MECEFGFAPDILRLTPKSAKPSRVISFAPKKTRSIFPHPRFQLSEAVFKLDCMFVLDLRLWLFQAWNDRLQEAFYVQCYCVFGADKR
jgi:hypothetical protein